MIHSLLAIDNRIEAALAGHDLSQCSRAVLHILATKPHIGSESAIQIRELQSQWRLRGSVVYKDRQIKAAVKELLELHGIPVGSSRSGRCGYFLCATVEDRRVAVRPLIAELVSLKRRIRAIDSRSTLGAVLAGQQELA